MKAPHQLPEDGGHGIGLRNVMERIRLNYGEDYGLIIESEVEKGTAVTVTVPCIPCGRPDWESPDTSPKQA
jgi:sensor histidine kinase YesM